MTEEAPGVLEAQGIALKDSNGTLRGQWTIRDDGGPSGLVMYDEDGKRLLALSEDPTKGSGLLMFGRDGETQRGGLLVHLNDSISLSLHDPDGSPRIGIVAMPIGAAFSLFDSGGTKRGGWSISADGTLGFLMADVHGKTRGLWSVREGPSGIAHYDQTGEQIRTLWGVEDDGAKLMFFDPDGKTRASWFARDDGMTVLHLNGANEKASLLLGASPTARPSP